jgi:hypothetical protein
MTDTRYSCGNLLRRGKVLDASTLNGIDFLEVLDNAAIPVGLPRQTTLLLHFLHPFTGLAAENFILTGGVRTNDVAVMWAYRADAVPTTLVTAAQAAYFAKLPSAESILVLRTNGSGDYSTYTLTLVRGTGQPAAPTGYDPRLASVDFSFKVECPSDFDCATSNTCAPPQPVDPPIDYLAKDYASFRQLMLDRMATTIPNWTERSPADLGVALVETLAYAADRLSYFQDAVATEAYLGTARRRTSVRRHAVLLGYAMHDGCNARAWVFLEVEAHYGIVTVPDPKVPGQNGIGTLLMTQSTFPTGYITAKDAQTALASGLVLPFEAMHGLTARSAHNGIRFYTWSDNACCLPTGSTAATLRDDGTEPLMLQGGDALLIEEVISPVTGAAADADASHRCVVRLTSVTPSIDPLTNIPVVEIAWAVEDALPFTLCISASVIAQGGAMLTDLSVARGNMLLVDHGLSAQAEPLQPAIVPTSGSYRPILGSTDLTFAVPYNDVNARASAVSTLMVQDPRSALPWITLAGVDDTWLPVRNLLNASPFEHSFVVETEDDGIATLRFGDGNLGELPQSGLTAQYRAGNGVAGNVGAGAITNIALQHITSVRNPLPATGGIDPEPTDQVRLYAPQAFRLQQRAVTAADYAAVTERRPDVQKAQATRRWTGSWYTMFVTVEGADTAVDAAVEDDVATYLDPFRLMGYDVEVKPPVFVPLDIAFTVCVKDGYLRGSVEAALYQVFSNRRISDGQTGFFYPRNFTFGQTVYLSQLIALGMQVPGVQWINTEDTGTRQSRFQRWGQAPAGELLAGEIDFTELEIAQLSNDPSAPENGRIQFFMLGGL